MTVHTQNFPTLDVLSLLISQPLQPGGIGDAMKVRAAMPADKNAAHEILTMHPQLIDVVRDAEFMKGEDIARLTQSWLTRLGPTLAVPVAA